MTSIDCRRCRRHVRDEKSLEVGGLEYCGRCAPFIFQEHMDTLHERHPEFVPEVQVVWRGHALIDFKPGPELRRALAARYQEREAHFVCGATSAPMCKNNQEINCAWCGRGFEVCFRMHRCRRWKGHLTKCRARKEKTVDA